MMGTTPCQTAQQTRQRARTATAGAEVGSRSLQGGDRPQIGSTEVATFFVPGVPQPAGSKKGFVHNGRAIIVDDAKRGKPWRVTVQGVAREAFQDPPVAGALRVDIVFVMPRPKGHYGKRGLKDSAPTFHTVRPDALKLGRHIEDCLSAIIWRDDSQIAVETLRKEYGDSPGAHVTIQRLIEP